MGYVYIQLLRTKTHCVYPLGLTNNALDLQSLFLEDFKSFIVNIYGY